MQFLKILFWFLLAFVAALFTYGNWATVPIRLWSGMIADVNLPLLLFVTFLVGLVPMLIYHHAVRWRLRNRLATAERSLVELSAPPVAPYIPLQHPDAIVSPPTTSLP